MSADLTASGTTTSYGPIVRVAGHAPPPYHITKHAELRQTTLDLKPSNPLHPILHLDEKDIETTAASPRLGIDAVTSFGRATIGSAEFVLTDNPLPLGIASVLELSFSATDIHSRADFSHVFGSNHNFVSGDASFGSLTIGGALIGRTLTFSGDAAPNTVLFSSPTVTVTLDKQAVADFLPGPQLAQAIFGPVSITTDAVDISLHNAPLFGTKVSGDIIIGQSSAGTVSPIVALHPQPS